MNQYNLFKPPFRVGRHLKRVVLNADSREVVSFKEGLEDAAQEYCNFLNTKYQVYDKEKRENS